MDVLYSVAQRKKKGLQVDMYEKYASADPEEVKGKVLEVFMANSEQTNVFSVFVEAKKNT